MSSLDDFARGKLEDLDQRSLRRRLVTTERTTDARAFRGSAQGGRRELLSFCCNDYLNLSQHAEVKSAAADAVRRFGAGAGASRHVTGNHPLYEQLEARLARFKQTEAAVVFGSGYLVNLGVVPIFAGRRDLLLVDELAHACLHGGAQLAGGEMVVYRHNDMNHIGEVLAERRAFHRHALILTDGVFSMDGDLAPLEALTALAEQYDAWLMTDDAHGLGIMGEGAGSTLAAARRSEGPVRVPLQMGTLSKAVGSYGGYLCASQSVVDFVKTRARTLIYTTGLPPSVVAASLAALDIIERDGALRDKPLAHARLFAELVHLPAPESPIVPVILKHTDLTLYASALLEERGFLVTAIRPPTVPEGTARLRFTFTSAHGESDIRRLAHIVRSEILPKAAA